MKLGFITNNDLAAIEADAQFAVEHGFAGLEINHWKTFADLTAEQVRDIRAVLDKYGVQCSTLGLWGWNHIAADADERAKAHHELGRAIEFADMLGAPVLITGGGLFREGDLAANVAEYAKVMPGFVASAADKGIKVALYGFHGGSFLATIEAYEALWEAMPQVGLKFDPANLDHAGQDYLKMARHHADKVAHVHIKEHLTHDGALVSQPAAGMGDIHWGKVMAFLYEADYRGYLTIEPHGPVWSRGALRHKMLLLTRKHLDQFLLP